MGLGVNGIGLDLNGSGFDGSSSTTSLIKPLGFQPPIMVSVISMGVR